MSKVESTADDAKKLAQRCKALEAQLRQTITKKEHHEIVLEFEDKMTSMEKTVSDQERKIGEQEKELGRTKGELQRSLAMNSQIAEVSGQVTRLAVNNDSQAKTLDLLVAKVTQGAVPLAVHQQTLSKIGDLEERIGGMVSRSDYAALRLRYEEAERRIANMVPAAEHEVLKERILELEGTISTMVPRDELESSRATVRELQAKLAERVPQSIYDELVSRVVQLAEDVTGGQALAEDQEPAPLQNEPAEPEQPSPVEIGPGGEPQIPASPVPLQPAETEPAAEAPGSQGQVVPEIREVGSKLAELKVEAMVEAEPAEAAPAEAAPSETPRAEEKAVAEVVLAPVAGGEPAEKNDQQA